MEKKNRLTLTFILLIAILVLIVILLFKLERQFYWIIVLVIVFLIMRYKIDAKKIMLMGLISFSVSVVFAAVNMLIISEFIMRTSFVFWISGLIMAMRDILTEKKTNKFLK